MAGQEESPQDRSAMPPVASEPEEPALTQVLASVQALRTQLQTLEVTVTAQSSNTQSAMGMLNSRLFDLEVARDPSRLPAAPQARSTAAAATTAAAAVPGGGLRVALLVYPDYRDVAGTIEGQLISYSLLPPPFRQLDVPGHMTSLRIMLRDHGFFVRSMDMHVSRDDLKAALSQAVGMKPSVLMLVFCGHGSEDRRQRQAAGHGVLLLSGGKALDTWDLTTLLQGFQGTLIQLLNMCHAAPQQPVPMNASLKPDKDSDISWGCQGQDRTQPPPLASHKLVSFFSCCSGEAQSPQYATAVLEAFIAAAGRPYAEVRTQWPVEWPRQLQLRPHVHIAGDYSGVFPGPAE